MPSSVSSLRSLLWKSIAAARGEGVDGIGEASNAVVTNNMPLARNLDAPGILDPLGPGPGRGAFDQIVRDEVISGCPLGVPGGGEAVSDTANMAVPHDDPRGVVEHGTVDRVLDREAFEPDVVTAGRGNSLAWARIAVPLGVDDGGARALAAPDDRLAGRAAMADRPGSLVDPGSQQEQIAGSRGLLGGYQAPEGIALGSRAASGAGHDVADTRGGGDERLGPGRSTQRPGRLPAIRGLERQPELIGHCWFQEQCAAGE